LVICVAPNGARRGKLDHPALPITPSELAKMAAQCCAAGARALHLHVRDEAGRHTLDAVHYRPALQAIRAEVGQQLVVQITTEAVGMYTPRQQIECVRAVIPEAASVAIRELIPTADDEGLAGEFFLWAADRGVALQYIIYSPEEASRLVQLVQRGVIADSRPHALFVLGRYTEGQRSAPADVLPFLRVWPSAWPWSLCAFGDTEASCAAAAIALGGHVRVGFENNLLRVDGQLAADNSEQVANIRALADCCGRPLADISQARDIYGVTAPVASPAPS
jgi:3-keto-5-aminohexanoate cleavage enzyme